MLERRIERAVDEIELDRAVDRAGLVELQRAVEQVHVSEAIGYYLVDLVAATRTSNRVQVGASPRGTLALLKLSRARAALRARDFVTPEDTKAVAVPALAHRLMLPPWVTLVDGRDPVAVRLHEGETSVLRFRVRCDRWGAYMLGRVFLRGRGPYGFVTWEWHVAATCALKVYPREESIRTLLRPLE